MSKINAYVTKLKNTYNNIKGNIPFETYEKIAVILDNAEDDVLIAIADGKIRLLSGLALRRCWDRGLKEMPR